MRRLTALFAAGALTLGLTACDMIGGKAEEAPKTSAKKAAGAAAPKAIADMPGTPMAQRVAVVGLLNKRNGSTRDIELKPGQALKIGDKLVIRVRACERTAPWETHPDIGIFVQLIVNERDFGDDKDKWEWAFSGWLFKENPAKNVVQHPIYDVWVKDCRMTFPGEDKPPVALGLKDSPFEDEDTAPAAPAAAANRPSSAPQSTPRPAAATAPEPEEEEPAPEPVEEPVAEEEGE